MDLNGDTVDRKISGSAQRRIVPFVDLVGQHTAMRDQLLDAVRNVLNHGQFILGPEVSEFEKRFSQYCGVHYAVGVASGTDALFLSLRALNIGPGDEVITAPNSFLASASAIVLAGARPVFVDVTNDYNLDPFLIGKVINKRSKAIMPVHLTGRPARMDEILDIAGRHGLAVIEDAAQAVGAEFYGKRVGSFGITGCFSLHPLKNLNACGDGGIITTNDETIYRYLLEARNHGLRSRNRLHFWSPNSRLDTIQAAMLLEKMQYLDEWTESRRSNARFYQERLGDMVEVPTDKSYERSVYHTFVIQTENRDNLRSYLAGKGIETGIHYPISIHLQEAAHRLGYKRGDFPVAERQAGRILSLPIWPGMSEEQLATVVKAICDFFAC
jgi:dTDP-4-amino-4,6-dideoxygalactose transaminase